MSGQPTAVIGDQNIVGYHLVNVGNTTTTIIYHTERGRPLTLESCVAFDALLNAKQRYPAPKCHPDTRQAAQAVVKDWIWRRGDDPEKDIMWMSGAPGVGKSAIVQTVGETLGADDGSRSWFSRIIFGNGYIDACYFFSRGCGDREKAASFPATIAYQLARSRPSLSWSIKNAIAANPSIFEESWPSQFRHLVLKPAMERWSFLGPVTVVIDGLDECDSDADQVALLNLILEATATKKMRFLIASRPDQAIEMFFSQMHVSPCTSYIRLDEKRFNTRRDIEVFLRAKFAIIRQLKPEGCPRLANGEGWPGGAVIRQIADDSDCQFMFPELAVNFIDLPGFSPNEQLRILLSAPPPHAFSKLDALYDKILSYRPPSQLRRDDNSPVDYRDTIMGILQIVIAWPNGPFSPARIAELLDEKVDVVQSIIRGPMRSLFKGVSSDPHSPVTLCHKSLRDYLLDRRRSKDFCISCGDAASFFTQILSQRPPTNPLQMYFPGAVMDVLTALLVKGGRSSMHEVAGSICLDYNFVERVVYGPARLLFHVMAEGVWLSTPNLQSFLIDADRAGEFYIPRTDPDAIFFRIVTRQSLPSTPYSQDVWMEILTIIYIKPFPDLNISGIAFVLGIPPKVVEVAVLGPTKSLFTVGDAGRVGFSTPTLPSFLSDPERAGQLYIPLNKRDTLYTSILSRTPPTDPSQAYPRDALLNVLAVVNSWKEGLTVPQIAAVLDVDPSAVDMVVSGTPRSLFSSNGDRICLSSNAFAEFLSNPTRAGELCAPDAIFTQILSRASPSNPSQTYSRDVLIGVLAVVRDWGRGLTVSQILRLLDVDPSIVNDMISGNPLFINKDDEISFSSTAFARFISDAERAGEYFVTNAMLDNIFTQILSRPPSDPSQAYSRDILMGVLAVVRHWGKNSTISEIAGVLDIDPGMANSLISGNPLFNNKHDRIFFSHPALADFLSDPKRAGDYFVTNATLDNIFIRILSHQPCDPSQTYPRDVLMGVLAVVRDWGARVLTVSQIAAALDVDPGTVNNVISGKSLFTKDYNRISFSTTAFPRFISDAERAGEYFVTKAMLDNIFTRILSRPPPSNPSQTYPRDLPMRVLAASRLWENDMTAPDIADVLDVGLGMVNNVISGKPIFAIARSGEVTFSSPAFARFISDAERAGEYFLSNVIFDPIYNTILSRHPKVPDALCSSSRQMLLDVLAVFTLIPAGRTKFVSCRTEVITSVLNLSTWDINNVVFGPAKFIFGHQLFGSITICDKLTEFLGDVDRAGEFYIPDEAKALAEAEYSHYASIYERFRRMEKDGELRS